MKLRTSGNKCACGNVGCFETFSSATAIRKKAQSQMEKGRDTVMKKADRVSAKTVFDAAKMGDELALEVIDKASYYIARAIQILTVTVDPDVVYVGGGLSKAGSFLIEKIDAHYKALAFPNVKDTPIKQATLVEKANIFGGYALVKHHG
jgi:glucokinase